MDHKRKEDLEERLTQFEHQHPDKVASFTTNQVFPKEFKEVANGIGASVSELRELVKLKKRPHEEGGNTLPL